MLELLQRKKVRALITQVLLIGLVLWGIAEVTNNVLTNLENLGIATGFGFMAERSGYDINFSLTDYSPLTATHFDAYIAGLLNTLLFSAITITITTVLGVTIAILRLSPNLLMSKLSYCYVEYIRNVPMLVHIFVWYAILVQLPSAREAIQIGPVFFSNRGLILPEVNLGGNGWILLTTLGLGMVISYFMTGALAKAQGKKWRELSSKNLVPYLALPFFMSGVAIVLIAPDIILTVPRLQGFNFTGGIEIPPELIMISMGVSIYSAAHTSEIVRGGIVAVSRGQYDAAAALGVPRLRAMLQIIIPQALAAIIPPLTSVYINIVKASALGIAVGYMDLMGTTGGSTLSITGQAVESILIVMATYVVLNLSLAGGMNFVNRKVLKMGART